MGKKTNKFKGKIENRTSFMYPSLHSAIVEVVSPTMSAPSFQEQGTGGKPTKIHKTNVMGKFHCANSKCATIGWGSKKVATVIRQYGKKGYNAEVYNQHCRSCKEMGTFILDETSYVERVAYRLQKWAGVQVQPPSTGRKKSKPHRSKLCKGCKAGVCSR